MKPKKEPESRAEKAMNKFIERRMSNKSQKFKQALQKKIDERYEPKSYKKWWRLAVVLGLALFVIILFFGLSSEFNNVPEEPAAFVQPSTTTIPASQQPAVSNNQQAAAVANNASEQLAASIAGIITPTIFIMVTITVITLLWNVFRGFGSSSSFTLFIITMFLILLKIIF